MGRIALVTAASARALDDDLPPLLQALGDAAEVVVWDDPAVDWNRFDVAVVRSTWDYVPRRDEFLAWAERVPRLHNPASILRWNTDKRYLAELDAPIVPTHWIAPGEPVRIPFDGEVVVKPSISAGARDTARHGNREAAESHVRLLMDRGRTAMIQPYLDRIDEAGETALIYVDGNFSHAIRKGPLLLPGTRTVGGLFAEEDIRPREPSAEERRVADRVIAGLPRLLYARVDLAPGPMVLELELTEPSLFFAHAPGSAERFARAVTCRRRA